MAKISRRTASFAAETLDEYLSKPKHAGIENPIYKFFFNSEYPVEFLDLLRYHYRVLARRIVHDLATYDFAVAFGWQDVRAKTHVVTDHERRFVDNEEARSLCDDLLLAIVGHTIEWLENSNVYELFNRGEELKRLAELDGFVWRDGRLVPVDSGPGSLPRKQDLIEQMMNSVRLLERQVILKHLSDSADLYLSERWKASSSESRHFLEQVLRDICNKTHGERKGGDHPKYKVAVEVRRYFRDVGFFTDDEVKALAGVWGFLSGTGGHPGLTDQQEALLSRSLALEFVHYLLLKFEDWASNNYRGFSRP